MIKEKISIKEQFQFAVASFGWSVVVNIVNGLIVYFYNPVGDSQLITLIPKTTIFGIFSILSLIILVARLIDAFIDPGIANFSDKSQNKKGRRIPLMKKALLPILITGLMLWMPISRVESSDNSWWLLSLMILFNVSISFYVIPYNALLPELGHDSEVKLRISTIQSISYFIGLIVASTPNVLVNVYQDNLNITDKFQALQLSIWTVYIIGWAFLLSPLWINEKKLITNKPVSSGIGDNFKSVLKNKNVLIYLIADFTYFTSLTIIATGALYYVKALLHLQDKHGTGMVATCVGLAMILSPIVYMLAKKVSKKRLVLFSLIFLSIIFSSVRFLGSFGIGNIYEAYILAALLSIPLSVLGIVPPVILAELTQVDAFETNQNREGIFFGIRSLFIQIGQTFGAVIFAILIGLNKENLLGEKLSQLFPKIPFDELGIRLSGIFGFALCLVAAILFSFFNEKSLEKGLEKKDKELQN